MVKNLPATQETQIQSRGWAKPLEKGMATHSSILGSRIPWTEEPGRATVHEVAKSWTQLLLSLLALLALILIEN